MNRHAKFVLTIFALLIVIALILSPSKLFEAETWTARPEEQSFHFVSEVQKLFASAFGFVLALQVNKYIVDFLDPQKKGKE